MVEGTGLENRRTCKGIVSSNLTLSVERLERATRRVGRGSAYQRVVVSGPVAAGSVQQGRVAEWFKAHAWKVCVRESVPWVRIPPRPFDRFVLTNCPAAAYNIAAPVRSL